MSILSWLFPSKTLEEVIITETTEFPDTIHAAPAKSLADQIGPVIPMDGPTGNVDVDYMHGEATRGATYYLSGYKQDFSPEAEKEKQRYRDCLATDCIADRDRRPEKYGFLKDPRACFIAFYSGRQRMDDGIRGVINHKSAYTAMFSQFHTKEMAHQLKNYPDSKPVFIGKNFVLTTKVQGIWLEATYVEALFKEVK